VGEYGAYPKPGRPAAAPYRKDWIGYITKSISRHGLVPMYWDTGGLIDRATGVQKEPDINRLIIDAAR
jgi:endoglucanase